MKPSPAQVHAALLNYYRPLRTPDARVRDAIEHAKHSKEKAGPEGPAQDIFSQTKNDVCGVGEQGNNHVSNVNST